MDNTLKPRSKDAKQHSTQLAWLKRCDDLTLFIALLNTCTVDFLLGDNSMHFAASRLATDLHSCRSWGFCHHDLLRSFSIINQKKSLLNSGEKRFCQNESVSTGCRLVVFPINNYTVKFNQSAWRKQFYECYKEYNRCRHGQTTTSLWNLKGFLCYSKSIFVFHSSVNSIGTESAVYKMNLFCTHF